MATFPTLPAELFEKRLAHPTGRVRMVLDTDTYNEIDDQFAVVYALLSPEKLTVEAIYAAPFHNNRSTGPADGMEKSYDEILRLLERIHVPSEGFVYRGSTEYLTRAGKPVESEAARDLIERALAAPDNDPLYVVAIGAITNVASALLLAPEIARKIVVVWLGGQPHHLPFTGEFNFSQDPAASKLMFDCGVPFVQIPCQQVASHLLTTKAELAETIAGRNPICDFLYERFCEYSSDHFAWAKEIWDVSAVAWLLNEEWVPSYVVPSPLLEESGEKRELAWRPATPGRHPIRTAWMCKRNPIFRDMFAKLQNAGR